MVFFFFKGKSTKPHRTMGSKEHVLPIIFIGLTSSLPLSYRLGKHLKLAIIHHFIQRLLQYYCSYLGIVNFNLGVYGICSVCLLGTTNVAQKSCTSRQKVALERSVCIEILWACMCMFACKNGPTMRHT